MVDPVIHRDRRVVDVEDINLNLRAAFTTKFVACRIVKEGVAKEVLFGEEEDLSLRAQFDGAAGNGRDRDDLESRIGDGGVVLQQQRRVDDETDVLVGKADHVVFGIESARAGQPVDVVAIPDQTVGKADLLDPQFAADEMLGHAHRVGGEPVAALKLDQQIVALADQGDIGAQDLRRQFDHVDVGGVAQLCHGVVQPVGAKDVSVRPGGTGHGVIAISALEPVGARVTRQGVGMGRPDEVLDPAEGVALGLEPGAGAAGQIDRHAARSAGVIGGVDPAPAVDLVPAQTAAQDVVAAVAAQDVVVERALDNLDPGKAVALGVPAAGAAIGHVDRHASRRQTIAGGVHARAAGEAVATAPADQRVIARPAVQRVDAASARKKVRALVPGQRVVKVGPGEVLDPRQRVARRIAARRRIVDKRDLHSLRRECVVGRVDPVAAVSHIRARAADDGVVACTGLDRVVAVARLDGITAAEALDQIAAVVAKELVGILRPDQVLRARDEVAVGKTALPQTGDEIETDSGIGGGVIQRIDALAQIDLVRTGGPDDRIIAAARHDGVVALKRLERLAHGRPDQQINLWRTDVMGQLDLTDGGDDGAVILDAFAVGDGVDEIGGAAEPVFEFDDDELVFVNAERADGRQGRDKAQLALVGERADVDIAVIRHQVRDPHDEGHGECACHCIGSGGRGVVHRLDGDPDPPAVGAVLAVRDHVIEIGQTVDVQIGGDQDIPVTVQRHGYRTVDRGADGLDRQGIAVDVGVISKERGGVDGGRDVFVNRDRIVRRNGGCVVDRFDPQGRLCVVDAALAIDDGITEAGLTPEIGIGRKADLARRH